MKLAVAPVLLIFLTVPYLLTQRIELRPAVTVPATKIDHAVPFRPGWALVYVLFYPLVVLGGVFQTRAAALMRFAIALLLAASVAYVIFLAFPTTVPRPARAAGEEYAIYNLLVRIDRPRNALPSLHAALALITGLGLEQSLRSPPVPHVLIRMLMRVWMWSAIVLILYSTIATRQHVLLDLIAGLGLGALSFAVAGRVSAWLRGNCLPALHATRPGV